MSTMKIDKEGKWNLYTVTLPANSIPIGTVTVKGETGALAYIQATKTYVRVNSGAVHNLDGRTVAGVLGISGRPQSVEDGKRINVFLDKSTIEKAKKIGSGNLSSGIRTAVRALGDNKND